MEALFKFLSNIMSLRNDFFSLRQQKSELQEAAPLAAQGFSRGLLGAFGLIVFFFLVIIIFVVVALKMSLP